MNATSTGPVHFLNLEYFFRLLYESRANAPGIPSFDGIAAWAMQTWDIVIIVSFILSLIALGVLIYSTIRMYQVIQLEHHRYDTITFDEAETAKDHSRWAHVQDLIESSQASDWRQAIIEADIMLDEALAQRGYPGDTLGDRLKVVPKEKLSTLEAAWEAHRVRNDIAHQGSAYHLDDNIAYRTVKKYESVFKELGEI